MLRARANEIHELVARLGSRRRTAVDAARARLSVIGGRAVENLIEALEGDDDRIRARVMPLLALIQDPRGRCPLIAMLLDQNPRLREIAAQCLGRFPSPESVVALGRLLRSERRRRVRVAAVRSLVELYHGGQEGAVSHVLERLADPKEPRPVRLAALALLPGLRPDGRKSLLRKLQSDPDPELRRAAGESEAALAQPGSRLDDIGSALEELGSDDYAAWNRAVQRLAAGGEAALQPLVAEMQSRAHDPEYCTRAGMALKALGPRRGRAVADALDEIDEPLPLQVLVEVIGAFGEKPLIYRLKNLIERIADARPRRAQADGLDLMQRVRAKAHLELARIGSRVAIQDLREALADPDRRLELELLTAVRTIGKKDEITVLLRAFCREDELVRREITAAVREIMRRERIRRNNRMFHTLPAEQAAALREILPPVSRSRKRRPPPPPDAP